MKELRELVSNYIEEYRKKREKLKRFLEKKYISFVKDFDVKEKTIFLICSNIYEKHILEMRKNDLIDSFKKNFGTENIKIVVEERDE